MKKKSIFFTLLLFAATTVVAQQTTYRADKIFAKKHLQVGDYVIEGFTTSNYADFLDSNKVPTNNAVRSYINRRLDTSRSIASSLVTHWQLDSTVGAGGGGSMPTNYWKTDSDNPIGSVLGVADKSFKASIGGIIVMEINKWSSANKTNSILFGYGQNTYGNAAIGIGAFGSAADSCISVGYLSTVAGVNSIGIGNRVLSKKNYTIALGNDINGPADDSGTDFIKDSSLYISRYVKRFHLKLDSATGSPPNFVGIGPDGYWHRYALPSGGGSTPGINAVLGVDSVGYHNIFLRGSKSFSAQSNGDGFGEATLYHTEGTGGQLFLSRANGYGANLMPVSGATGVSTNYLPDTTGIYTMYVNGAAPNSKGKLNLFIFPDSIVTPVIKSKGGASLQIKVGSNTPLTFNADNTMTAGGNFSSPYTFEGFILKANGLVQTPASGYFDFNSRSKLYSPADGQILLRNNTGTDFGMLQFGGTTSSFPALKRSSTKLQIRLGDDSGFGAVEGSNIRSGTGTPEGVVSAPVGTLFSRTDGAADSSAYIKTSGIGSGGWKKISDVSKYADSIALLRFRLDSLESILLPLDSLDVDESLTKTKIGNVTTLGVNSSNYYDRNAVDGLNSGNYSSSQKIGDSCFILTRNSGTKDTIQFPQKKYREYVAILNQAGSSAPVATVVDNELGDTITYTYEGNGYYKAHSTGLFTVGKTVVLFTSGNVNSGNVVSVQARATSDSVIELSTGYSLSQSDDTMLNDNFIIRVYN